MYSQQEIQQSRDESIQIFDLILAVSQAKDLYAVCLVLSDADNIQKNEKFHVLRLTVEKIVTIFVRFFFDSVHNQTVIVRDKLFQAGIGNAPTLIAPIQKKMQIFHQNLIKRIPGRNFLDDHILGQQLFKTLLEKRNELIHAIEIEKSQRKFDEDQLKKIEEALIAYSKNDELLKLSIPKKEIEQLIAAVDAIIKTIIEEFKLDSLGKSFDAFNELLTVSNNANRLTAEEVDHFKQLIIDYLNTTGMKDKADIIKMLHFIDNIRPIFSAQIDDYLELLDAECLLNKAFFIRNNFSRANSQVHKTYEGLSNTINAYLNTLALLREMQSLVKGHQRFTEAKLLQIEKYKATLTSYFQLTTQLAMPLKEFNSHYEKIYNFIKTKEKNSLVNHLEKAMTCLQASSDFLSQKIRSINALKDVADFISRLKEALNKEKPLIHYFLDQFHRNYKPALTDILNFFSVTVIRKEAQGDFQYILDGINDILNRYKIRIDLNKNVGKCPEEEALILEIYHRYTDNLAKYQKDMVLEKTATKSHC